ncbi:alpha/beta fold hydrolase [Pedobacter metabolipauper]|uniref:Pimeloyl-ACP methyl ester carboxylesterase n=1 Tax=Pedobacter metabolipauper TaxID=425513 RepID=A0A4R6T062_9SPHI|nr:alpha/beta hydrolase [Pedobacter metabolipauper]TDQ11747.1 pimeloyl-ACP methyl ester carboxylesterase [Pedobacter metabolipauper]
MKIVFILYLFALSSVAFGQEKLVNVNGSNYHVLVKGFENRRENAPVIIFENGMGVDLGNWKKITDQVSSFAPVLAYDRAGVGKTDKIFKMPTTKFVAENLHDLLKVLKIAPPYILVGHSLGGVYIRSFAGLYPNEVSGLVFIDPADFTETKNDWNAIFRTMGVPEKKIDDMLYTRLYQQKQKVDSLNFGPWSERLVLNDLRITDFAEISKLPLPNVPIYFFVGGKFEVPPEQRSKDFDQEAFFHIKNNANIERWKKLMYASNKGGTLIYLTNSGHYVHWDDPKSVINNIKILVESLKE